MVVLNQIHGKLSSITDDLLADAVSNEGLLEQDVTAVFSSERIVLRLEVVHSVVPAEFLNPPVSKVSLILRSV